MGHSHFSQSDQSITDSNPSLIPIDFENGSQINLTFSIPTTTSLIKTLTPSHMNHSISLPTVLLISISLQIYPPHWPYHSVPIREQSMSGIPCWMKSRYSVWYLKLSPSWLYLSLQCHVSARQFMLSKKQCSKQMLSILYIWTRFVLLSLHRIPLTLLLPG